MISRLCPGVRVAIGHGQMEGKQLEKIMMDFINGEYDVLLATTIIESGIDISNANTIIINDAQNFGLSDLHQLRGRIGRGGHKGYCILLTDGKNPEALEKLKVLEATSDGFEIAEADLRLRGPGDVLGTVQSGLSDLRFIDFLTDTGLLREARALADKVLSEDPLLDGMHHALRALINKLEGAVRLPSTA